MVRILAVSDIHGTKRGLDAILRMLEHHSPDILVISGDLTNFGGVTWDGCIFDRFEIPVLAVNGNCDSREAARVLSEDLEHGLMDRSKELKGLHFHGLAYPADETKKFPPDIDVLVTHVPPRGCNDSLRVGHIGEEWLRDAVIKLKPRLVLSGHVHESRGICELGESICVNAGPAKEGFGAIVEISEKVQAKLIEA